MTNDAIDRAIKRGTGEAGGETYESITYEGYAPGGVALLIDVLTDNRNRTGAEIRSIFTKMGGSMAEPGAVGWQFERAGRRAGRPARQTRTTLMLAALEAGADDIVDDGGTWRVMSEPSVGLRRARTRSRPPGSRSSRPTRRWWRATSCRSPTSRTPSKVLRIMEAIEDNDDVQDVYSNFDIADDVMEAVEPDERRGRRIGHPTSRCPARRAARIRWPTSAGKPIVLVFYPGDDTPVCTKQLNAYNEGSSSSQLDAQVVGISAQSVDSHETSPASTGSTSRCWPTPTRRWPVCTARSVRSASRGAACSSSIATA